MIIVYPESGFLIASRKAESTVKVGFMILIQIDYNDSDSNDWNSND